MSNPNYIEHYGVKGMKWKKRKDGKNLNPEDSRENSGFLKKKDKRGSVIDDSKRSKTGSMKDAIAKKKMPKIKNGVNLKRGEAFIKKMLG